MNVKDCRRLLEQLGNEKKRENPVPMGLNEKKMTPGDAKGGGKA